MVMMSEESDMVSVTVSIEEDERDTKPWGEHLNNLQSISKIEF